MTRFAETSYTLIKKKQDSTSSHGSFSLPPWRPPKIAPSPLCFYTHPKQMRVNKMRALYIFLVLLVWIFPLEALQPRFWGRHRAPPSPQNCVGQSFLTRPSNWRLLPSHWFSAVPSDAVNETIFQSDAATLLRQAEEWRRQARRIMDEAAVLEAELQQSRSSTRQKREQTTAELLERLFEGRSLTPEAVAQVLRDEKWSAEEAEMALNGLFAQAYGTAQTLEDSAINAAESTSEASSQSKASPSTPLESSNKLSGQMPPYNATEAMLLETKMECLINGAEILDEIVMASKDPVRRWSGRVGSMLRAKRNELRRVHEQTVARQTVEYLGVNSANTSAVEQVYSATGPIVTHGHWQGPSFDPGNATAKEQVFLAPLWVPSTIFQYLCISKLQIETNEIITLKEKIFPGTAFFCTSSENWDKAAIFRGNIRGIDTSDRNSTETLLAEIQHRLDKTGLSKKLQILLMPDPEWRPNRDQTAAQEPPKPVILAIPADVVPDDQKISQKKSVIGKALKVTAATLPLLTTFLYSITCYALNPKFFDAVMNQRNLGVLTACLPVLVGVFAVQAVHELAHALVAKKWGIKIGLPFPIPSTQIGLFGCITPLKSFPKNRSALLDFALSGPLSAMMFSIGMMVAGIRLTLRASGTDILRFPVLPMAVLKSSFLAGSLLTVFTPKSMILPHSQPLALHPLFMAGFAGLLSSALNLLPIFRLDGGRACSAAMGSRFAAIASSGTLVFMFSLALSSTTGVAFAWGALVLLFQRQFEIPTRDEWTAVNDFRLFGWLGSLATAVLALVPFPGGTALM